MPVVFSRRCNEGLVIGGETLVRVIQIRGDKVRVEIDAPRHVSIHRSEVFELIARESVRAAGLNPDDMKLSEIMAAIKEREKGR